LRQSADVVPDRHRNVSTRGSRHQRAVNDTRGELQRRNKTDWLALRGNRRAASCISRNSKTP
jgi:hypothetical protein